MILKPGKKVKSEQRMPSLVEQVTSARKKIGPVVDRRASLDVELRAMLEEMLLDTRDSDADFDDFKVIHSTKSTKTKGEGMGMNTLAPFPPRWRDLDERYKPIAYLAVLSQVASVPFGVNLSPRLEFQTYSVSFIHRRIARNLKSAFGRPIDFWFALDLDHKGENLHLHGSLAIPPHSVPQTRKALHLSSAIKRDEKGYSNAVWLGKAGHFLKGGTTDGRTEFANWAAYAVRHRKAITAIIPGAQVTVTRPLGRDSRDLYESKRKEFLKR